jgi:putative NADH-flavin reductase
MKVLVMGATGGTGRATVAQLLSDGHQVTAFGRHPERVGAASERLRLQVGDALSASDVERAVAGQDAVVVTLGISENPLRVRLFGPAHTPLDVRSAGTRHAIAAMRRHGVRRLVVLSSYGVADTRGRLGLADRLFFNLILKPQIADTEKQHHEVSQCGLDWVLVQPVHLTDVDDDAPAFASTRGETELLKVSRKSVARFLARAAARRDYAQQSVSLSGSRAPRAVGREATGGIGGERLSRDAASGRTLARACSK